MSHYMGFDLSIKPPSGDDWAITAKLPPDAKLVVLAWVVGGSGAEAFITGLPKGRLNSALQYLADVHFRDRWQAAYGYYTDWCNAETAARIKQENYLKKLAKLGRLADAGVVPVRSVGGSAQ